MSEEPLSPPPAEPAENRFADGTSLEQQVYETAFRAGYNIVENKDLKTANETLEKRAVEAEHNAAYDSLTGLLNKRGFAEKMEDMLRPESSGQIGLIYIDIDGFKTVNDKMSHKWGDVLLQEFSQWLKGHVRHDNGRQDDIISHQPEVARDGGDEFVVAVDLRSVGEEDSQEQALSPSDKVDILADRLRTGFGAFISEHPNFERRGVGISVGVAIWEKNMTLDELKEFADNEMYSEKDSKRNEPHRH